jgi:hypothetical protein
LWGLDKSLHPRVPGTPGRRSSSTIHLSAAALAGFLSTQFAAELTPEFAAPLPIPSVAMHDPAFFRGKTPFIWRGPTWAPTNWLLYHALKKRGTVSRSAWSIG